MTHRKAGVLLHPTSLPGPDANGTFGRQAYRFIDFVAEAGLKVWQMLPLGPPDEYASPYQCHSTRAGHVGLIDRELLVEWGWVSKSQTDEWLAAGEQHFFSNAGSELKAELALFRESNAAWLNDYSLFVALKKRHVGAPWWEWEPALRNREPGAMQEVCTQEAASIEQCVFQQFVFDRQWQALRCYAVSRGVELFGDMPIFVSADSVDVWSERDCFKVDDRGHAKVVTGVPPDAYSATGQRWGSPHYDWAYIERHGFEWWKRRLRFEFNRFDIIRIDHFRGFAAAWEIPGESPTAEVGHWEPAPGEALFSALQAQFGELALVAEDLGLITDDVRALRKKFSLPGMCVLQFAFDGGADNPYLPHNHFRDLVVYTGTHDNDTTLGWFEAMSAEDRQRVCAYLGAEAKDFPAALIRTAFASVGDLAMVPLQDFLGLDTTSRMNTPGVAEGNWQWRFRWEQIRPELAGEIRELVERYGR